MKSRKTFRTFRDSIVGEDKVAVYHFNTQIQNVRMKETGIRRKKRQKDPRPTDFSRPSLKIHEEDEQLIYHVTHTKHVPKIQKSGIMPMKTSNWVKAGNKERYGGGEVYAFSHKADAHAWAGRMDWAHNQKLGSGNISIITAKRPKDRTFEVDDNDPLSQAGRKGDWLKTHGSIEPHHIVSVEKYMPKKLGEDKIGKKTASVKQIAKKHGLTIDQVNAQLDKGVPVEREHTNSDEEAREIARDHVHEFPDYYDRLDKMEKKAKKDMKEEVFTKVKSRRWRGRLGKIDPKELHKIMYPKQEVPPKEPLPVTLKGYERVKDGKFNILRRKKTDEGYDPEKEIIKNRIEAHKAVADMMAKKHGPDSLQATFHRSLVKRYEKQLVGEAIVKKSSKKKQSKKSWQADARLAKKSKDPKAIRNALKAHALRNEEVANSVGGGMSPVIGGEGNIHGFDPIFGKPVRRKKYAGKTVFVVDPTTYHKAYLGKRKYEHYEKYLEGCDIADEIRAFGRKYWDEPIIIENEQTGAMVYLKYGSK